MTGEKQVRLSTGDIPIMETMGCEFRDLNRNQKLDPYEDWRLPAQARAKDLLARLSPAEKAGQMLHANAYGNAPFGAPATGYNLDMVRAGILDQKITAFLSMLALLPYEMAAANNAIQSIAEQGRLGIPVVISTDPRNHFQAVAGASVEAAGFSQWPEPLGLAALGDPELVERFADIARQEYRATGFALALSPQADLATEPRWPRINGTFGENPPLAAKLVGAYVRGFQRGAQGLGRDSVATVVKHWVGYGAARDGFDSHNYYGRFGVLTTENLPLHEIPFEAAFDAKVSGVMPAYSIFPELEVGGKRIEPVGAGYSSALLQTLLRNKHQFGGIILSDWAITNDCGEICRLGFPDGKRPTFEGVSTAWGVEGLTRVERFAKAVNAGIDQFGGVNDATALLKAMERGDISSGRIDQSVLRILQQTFELGLFERPFVDEAEAAKIVGNARFRQEARQAQGRSAVVLENREHLLPIAPTTTGTLYLEGITAAPFIAAGFAIAKSPQAADLAIIRTAAPYETLHPEFFFGLRQHEGSLAFDPDGPEITRLKAISKTVPTIVNVYLDRPAVLGELKAVSDALLVNFGISDEVLAKVLTGTIRPEGRLPFELPSSMRAVEQQQSDVPNDSENPLYPIFYGLKLSKNRLSHCRSCQD
ncbi:glycoside hydrolase family 3 protein [Pseudomaricurvus alkylphenolicus]|uniref:glycoside hydrolase family 3 protein n=1 Tax=Pseudomaricurvus alkylphenolicus TaxID=1306991 RepID=UPI001981A525